MSERPGEQVDRQRQDDGVEEERQDAVDQRDPAHRARGDLDVRDLAGHADHERVVDEIPIVQRPLAGKGEKCAWPFIMGKKI